MSDADSTPPDRSSPSRADSLAPVFLERFPVIAWFADEDLTVRIVGGGALEDLALAPDEIEGRRLAEFFDDPAERERALDAHREALKGRSMRYQVASRGRIFEVMVEPVPDDDGRIRKVGGGAFDITALELARSALAGRDRILRAVSFAAQRFLTEKDPNVVFGEVLKRLGRAAEVDRAYIYQNRMGDGGLGAAQIEEWLETGIESIGSEEPAWLSYEGLGFQRWRVLLQSGEVVAGPTDTFPPSERDVLGTQEIRSLMVVPIFRESEWWGFMGFDDCERPRRWPSEVLGAMRVAAGILGAALRRRQIEEALDRRERELARAQRLEAVGTLAGGVAHDFRNALTVIGGNLDLLREALGDPEEVRGEMDAIEKAARDAADLTSQLLAFSRQQVLRPEVLTLNELVHESWSLLRGAVPERISLEPDLTDDPWSCRADRTQIHHVMVNLVLNARDAIPGHGRITIRTANEHVTAGLYDGIAEDGPFVCLTVEDTGVGMLPEVAARVFEPFFTTKGVGEGTGLGLAAVFGIVRQSGGGVRVDSRVGRGSSFTVCLPRYEPS